MQDYHEKRLQEEQDASKDLIEESTVESQEKGDSGLSNWDKVIKKNAEKHAQNTKELNEQLGEPDRVITLPGDEDHEYGLWRIKGGVISLSRAKGKTNWVIWSQRDFPESLIQALHSLCP